MRKEVTLKNEERLLRNFPELRGFILTDVADAT